MLPYYSSIALAKLLHHGVATNDTRLTEVTVTIEDDTYTSTAITDGADGGSAMRTRSQRSAAPYQIKEISILVKILKLFQSSQKW